MLNNQTCDDRALALASTLYEWSKSDYEAQWLRSLEQLIVGSTKVALITQCVNPSESSNLEWWALYRGEDDIVYVQNHLVPAASSGLSKPESAAS